MPEPKYSEKTLNRAAEMREAGASYVRIAQVLGMSRGAAYWHCLRLGADCPVEKRPKPSLPGPAIYQRGKFAVRRFSQDDDRILLEMEATGVRASEIAQALGRKRNSVVGRLMTLARRDQRQETGATPLGDCTQSSAGPASKGDAG